MSDGPWTRVYLEDGSHIDADPDAFHEVHRALAENAHVLQVYGVSGEERLIPVRRIVDAVRWTPAQMDAVAARERVVNGTWRRERKEWEDEDC
jgi:hypothetical protein